jgi:hypothetical protein
MRSVEQPCHDQGVADLVSVTQGPKFIHDKFEEDDMFGIKPVGGGEIRPSLTIDTGSNVSAEKLDGVNLNRFAKALSLAATPST